MMLELVKANGYLRINHYKHLLSISSDIVCDRKNICLHFSLLMYYKQSP